MSQSFCSKNISKFKKKEKPWGHEVIWADSSSKEGYVSKVLFIKAGHRLSLQYHKEKEETIFVKSGTLYVETIGRIVDTCNMADMLKHKRRIFKLFPGDTLHISRFMSHRFMANETNVELIEVSTKELDDVIRIEDDYERE
jgi:mannose-6-phosphate isomerase